MLKSLLFMCKQFVCIIIGGEVLSVAEPFLEQQMHPTVIISAFRLALEDILETLKSKIR